MHSKHYEGFAILLVFEFLYSYLIMLYAFFLAPLVLYCFLPLSVVYVLDSLFSTKIFTSLKTDSTVKASNTILGR